MLPIVGVVSDLAVTRSVQCVELDAGAVLRQAWRLYKRLFTRSIVIGGIVFGALHFLEALLRAGRGGLLVALLTLVSAVAGTALLQGALVEIVRGLHVDGDDDPNPLEALGRASGKVWKLVRLSFLSALGIACGFLLLVIPGFVLLTRWAVAVPAAMLEDGNARDALKRSRLILAGNGWNVFKVVFAAGLLTGLATIPFTMVARGAGPFGWWLSTTFASMLAAPYTSHALTVTYYALLQPERPVVLDPGERWGSIWDEQEASTSTPAESAWAEYERRFDERWGK
jgi:hypothetical protein